MKDNLSFYEHTKDASPVSIVSIPFEYGSDARGLSKAPQYLFDAGLRNMFSTIGRPLIEEKTIECPTGLQPTLEFPKFLNETAEVAQRAYQTVSQMRARGDTVVSLCGDHASAIGSIAGATSTGERVGVIYIDAHPDIHTHETTISGNTHAFVASASMGLGHPLLTNIGEKADKVRSEDFLFLGIKDFDEREPALLRQSGARVFTMLDIALHGLSQVTRAIDALSARVDTIWISMDMDSVDSASAPGVAMPCVDGFTRREIISLAHYIGKTCAVSGFDIVEILPENDVEQKTAALALELMARFLGAEYTWYRSYMAPYESKRARVQSKKLPRRRAAKESQSSRVSLRSS